MDADECVLCGDYIEGGDDPLGMFCCDCWLELWFLL